MVIFLYGADSYRSRQKLQEIVDGYKKVRKSGLNLLYVDAAQKDFADFYDSFKVASMFAETKLVILKNVFSSKGFQEDFLSKLGDIQALKDVVAIYEDVAVDERLKLFKTLKKECKSQEFSLLDGKNTRAWSVKKFESLGQKINADALDVMVSYIGNDLWRFSSEIQKLSYFRRGEVVRKSDVELLVRPRIELDIFKTIDALSLKNKAQALKLLQKHLERGDSPLYLLSMITYQFRNLLAVKELAGKGLMYNSIVKRSGLHPFVVKKNYFASSKFSFEELKVIYGKIFQVDMDIKTGKIEQETALDLLVAQI